jgi:5-formyltetrahydrofolate cyclo-ligase
MVPPDIKIAKQAARQSALARRDEIDFQDRVAFSENLVSRVEALPIPPNALVAGFIAIRSEIDPMPLMMALRQRGATLALPAVLADRETMIFRTWDGVTDLVKSSFGLSVPSPSAAEVQPSALLIPLAAFDRRGYRIGYGKGHYDRALARLEANRPVVKIGVAFSAQEIAEVPDEPHDRRLDYMLTEAEFFACKDL